MQINLKFIVRMVAFTGISSILVLATSCKDSVVQTSDKPNVLKTNSGNIVGLLGWGSRAGFEAGMEKLAGPNAVDCGRIPIREDRERAFHCVLAANKRKKPLRVVFVEQGIDSEVETAVVRTEAGAVTRFSYDGMGASSFSSSCPIPLRLQVGRAGEVRCDPLIP